MSSIRLEKIGTLIKKELSIIFQQNMHSHFQGLMITVTSARVSPDLSTAKIYLSFFPTEKKEEGIAIVNDKISVIRGLLGSSTGKQLRKIPSLSFFIDDSLDYFEEIDRLLKKK
ncbi:MAG: 30S ribosome-binding factor RbfA [Flavobacteriales bacterium]|jgi:ribosome-binding factor A